jgi:enoyl-CoA hydratase/carnithine racemase
LPPQAVAESRRLMRGSPDDLIKRIDQEAELFKVRLTTPEARAAFEAFLLRKR